MIKDLPKRLALATAAKPLFLFLDALDQLSNADNARNLVWLPAELTAYVRLVVSTLLGECLSALEKKLPGANFAELEPMPSEEGAKLLEMWLDDAHRKLQEDQRAEILRKFELCGMPLYLRLAFGEAHRWKSYDGLPLGSKGHAGLSEDIPGIIRDMFWRLSQESNHGRMLVERSLGYLAASRNGLTEDEMLDVLSQDDDLYRDFLKRTYHKPPEQRLPVVIWSRLFFDLEPYLTERSADGTSLLAFFHRQLGEVVIEDYLKDAKKMERHRILARYFGEKPYWTEIDKIRLPNIRKVSELPYQQAYAGMGELVYTLTDFSFMEAKLHALGIYSLIEDYELAFIPGIKVSEERAKHVEKGLRLIQGALRLSAYVLDQDKMALPSQLVGRLMTQETPEIHALLEQIEQRKGTPWLRPITPSLMAPEGSLLYTLKGHTGGLLAVAVTPDGRLAVSGSRDNTLKVWNLENGKEITTLKGHIDGVTAVAITPDGRLAVSGSEDKTVKIWDLERGLLIRTLEGHEGEVIAVAVTGDCQRVVSGSTDKTIKVWKLENGELINIIEDIAQYIYSIAITPNVSIAVSGSDDKTVKIWDLERCVLIRILEGHQGSVKRVAVTPDGRRAVSWSDDLTVRVWDLEHGKLLKTHSFSMWVNSIAITPDGCRALLGYEDPPEDINFEILDLQSGKYLRTLETQANYAIVVTSDGRRAVTGSSGANLKVWDIDKVWDLEFKHSIGHSFKSHHRKLVRALAVTPDGSQAVSGSGDDTLKFWSLENGQLLRRPLFGHVGTVMALRVTPDSRKLISASGDGFLMVWDIKNGHLIHTLEHDGLEAFVISPDGYQAISGSSDSTLKVWDLHNGRKIMTLQGDGDTAGISKIAITPDGSRVISGSDKGIINIWDLKRGVSIYTQKAHKDRVSYLGVAPDGQRLISASLDKNTRVWDLNEGSLLYSISNSVPSIGKHQIALTPDGSKIITCSDHLTLDVWELENGNYICSLIGHKDEVTSLIITSDGQRVITSSVDHTIKVWNIENGIIIATFLGEGIINSCAYSPLSNVIVAGEYSGRLHFLRIENVEFNPPIITAWRDQTEGTFAIGCPHCRWWSEVLTSALGIELPCPHCGKPIKLNPFTINADWRPVAKAWRGIR